jgi:hypothetical protein
MYHPSRPRRHEGGERWREGVLIGSANGECNPDRRTKGLLSSAFAPKLRRDTPTLSSRGGEGDQVAGALNTRRAKDIPDLLFLKQWFEAEGETPPEC